MDNLLRHPVQSTFIVQACLTDRSKKVLDRYIAINPVQKITDNKDSIRGQSC